MKRIFVLLLISLSLITFNQSCKKPVKVEPGTIHGVVTDKETGECVENVKVLLSPMGKTVVTKSDGYYEFSELEHGNYSLTASKNGYRKYAANQTINIDDSEIITKDIEMERLLSSFIIIDDAGNEINELDFGNANDDVARSFKIMNNGEIALDYRIENTVSWIVEVSDPESSLQPDSLKRITITIDRTKLSIGKNEAVLSVLADEMNMELAVKAYKDVDIITLDPTDITTNSAVLKGSISLDNRSITEKGFILYTDINAATEYVVSGNDIGEFSYNVSGLKDATAYNYKAYMILDEVVVYGEEKSFTTVEEIVVEFPEVVTLSVDEVTEYTAVFTGEVVSDGGAEVVERGFIWSNPVEEEDFRIQVGSGLGVYTYSVTGLYPNTDYRVLAYAINSKGEAVGEYISFTTLEEKQLINGYEYVDLGLPSGLKWATHNVGANSPEECGDYYAWGEIETKMTYTDANSLVYGLPMEDFSGDPQYDVASAKWGSTWRMPTRDEQKELLNNCTWEWTTRDGMNGYVVTGSNGNSIFLPAAGYHENTNKGDVGEYGYYWSSTPQENTNLGAYYLYMSNSSKLSYYYARLAGQSVRAVSE